MWKILSATEIVVILLVMFTSVLVLLGIRNEPKLISEEEPKEPVPSDDWLKTAYQTVNSLYIEVDREIWQISTIFTSASLLLMGWVVINFTGMMLELIFLIGSASILLVGIATLFKHRLREFNLFHISFSRRIERAISKTEEGTYFWGLHHLRRSCLNSKGKFIRSITSIHGVMDIYYGLFVILWAAIFYLAKITKGV